MDIQRVQTVMLKRAATVAANGYTYPSPEQLMIMQAQASATPEVLETFRREFNIDPSVPDETVKRQYIMRYMNSISQNRDYNSYAKQRAQSAARQARLGTGEVGLPPDVVAAQDWMATHPPSPYRQKFERDPKPSNYSVNSLPDMRHLINVAESDPRISGFNAQDIHGLENGYFGGDAIAHGSYITGGVIPLAATAFNPAIAPVTVPIMGATGAALPGVAIWTKRNNMAQNNLRDAYRRSVYTQRSNLQARDQQYTPWQKQFYESKGWQQRPTGQVHPATGQPVYEWFDPKATQKRPQMAPTPTMRQPQMRTGTAGFRSRVATGSW